MEYWQFLNYPFTIILQNYSWVHRSQWQKLFFWFRTVLMKTQGYSHNYSFTTGSMWQLWFKKASMNQLKKLMPYEYLNLSVLIWHQILQLIHWCLLKSYIPNTINFDKALDFLSIFWILFLVYFVVVAFFIILFFFCF